MTGVLLGSLFALVLIMPLLALWLYVRGGSGHRIESKRRSGVVFRWFAALLGVFGLVQAASHLLSDGAPTFTGRFAFAWSTLYTHFGQIGVAVAWVVIAAMCFTAGLARWRA